jgi:hypothetical protein
MLSRKLTGSIAAGAVAIAVAIGAYTIEHSSSSSSTSGAASSGLGSGGGDPTLGLDRPQGEHPARSAACPRRASQCRHQRVRR